MLFLINLYDALFIILNYKIFFLHRMLQKIQLNIITSFIKEFKFTKANKNEHIFNGNKLYPK